MPSFPVSLEAWLSPYRVTTQAFDLGDGLSVQNQTAGGEVIRSGGAARLWRGTFALSPAYHSDAIALAARLNVLRGAGAYFTVRDNRISGSVGATLATVQANGAVNISGGPAGHVLKSGDYISFSYAGRVALHQIVTGGALNASGAISGVEVVPPVRDGWAANTPIQIGCVPCRAVMVPGGFSPGQSNAVVHDGIQFNWIQTLREYP